MASYFFQGGIEVEIGDPRFDAFLEQAHRSKTRPRCACKRPSIEMYVARIGGVDFILKRMPDTGSAHAPDCLSYEPPPELSGLGQVLGSAVMERQGSPGVTSLKFDFALSKSGGRTAPIPGGVEHDSVRTDGTRLTLRSTLHYLWDQAQLTKWTPGMAGKRNWYLVRKSLLEASHGKSAKGMDLSELIYIPEMFSIEGKEAIAQRRLIAFSKAMPPSKGPKPLMIGIGEVKEFGAARYGDKMVIRHMPDCHLMLPQDLSKRMQKRFENELALWGATEGLHLVAIFTFGVSVAGVPSIDSLSLILVTANWIPVETSAESSLLDRLMVERRKFTRSLRYNMPSDSALASAILTDSEAGSVALYLIPAEATEKQTAALEKMMADSQFNHWVWHVGSEEMPRLPAQLAEPSLSTGPKGAHQVEG